MLKISNIDIYGWEAAIRGMRNPMNSWDKSDSHEITVADYMSSVTPWDLKNSYIIGPNDLKLMRNLSNAGPDHGKFLRYITVTMDIVAPLYWWKEFDTYKVGTVANSCSTMHKIQSKPLTMDDFSFDFRGEDFDREHEIYVDDTGSYERYDELVVKLCEDLRREFLKTNDKRVWRYLIQLLPSAYNQRRTVQLNYQVLKSMYHVRKNHKLAEWHTFCDAIRSLPYSELITGEE